MPADPYRHVSIGERLDIPAAGYNAAMDAAKSQRTSVVNAGRSIPQVGRNTGVVLIKNTSGYDLDRYGILGIDGVIFDHDASADEFLSDRVLFEGVTSADPDHVSKFVVALEMIPNGEIGRAVISGYVQAQVDITDADHDYAKIDDGVTDNLVSAGIGSQIIYKPDGIGVKWCVVRIGLEAAAMHLSCTVDESSHVSSSNDSFAVADVVGLDGSFADTEITDVDNTLLNNHHFDDSPLILAWNQDEDAWMVVYDGSAKFLLADASEAADGVDFDVDGIAPMHGHCDVASTSDNGVENPLGYIVTDDDKVVIAVEADGTLNCVAVEGGGGESITVVTDLQVTGTTIQKKTRTVKVSDGGTESGWTTWHTGTECP